jgi:hypothetical protein
MNSLFIDTSGWASLFISTQPYYHQAEQYFRLSLKQQKKLYTTNYILAELVALLNSPLRVSRSRLFEIIAVNRSMTGQCEVLGKSTSLLGFQPPTPFYPLPDSQSLKPFQCKAFRHFIKMSDRELRTLQSMTGL